MSLWQRANTPEAYATQAGSRRPPTPQLQTMPASLVKGSRLQATNAKLVRPIIEIENVNMTFHVKARDLTVFENLTYKFRNAAFFPLSGHRASATAPCCA